LTLTHTIEPTLHTSMAVYMAKMEPRLAIHYAPT
jgi:hypothetical protein